MPKMNLGDSAFKTSDKPYLREEDLYKVNQQGVPEKKILIDLESKDMTIFWRFHERKLWSAIILCNIYFIYVLIL